MPMTKVYLRKGRSADERRAISDAVHRALVEVIGIPDDDLYHVFHELDDDNLISAPVAFGLERRREAVFIQFYFAQRPAEKLRQLWASVVANLGELTDLEPRDIYLNLVPSASENWWADGRVLDTQTGYDARMDQSQIPAS
jgi:phenylpyruvate tautomerase PptA (4-oxalocrotonate tautomerase family)